MLGERLGAWVSLEDVPEVWAGVTGVVVPPEPDALARAQGQGYVLQRCSEGVTRLLEISGILRRGAQAHQHIVVDDLPLTKQIHTPPTLTLTTTRRTARVIQHQLPPPQHRLVILAAQTKHLPLPILIIRADILVILLVHTLHFLQRLDHRPAEVEREIVPVVVARGVPAGFARVLGLGLGGREDVQRVEVEEGAAGGRADGAGHAGGVG